MPTTNLEFTIFLKGCIFCLFWSESKHLSSKNEKNCILDSEFEIGFFAYVSRSAHRTPNYVYES